MQSKHNHLNVRGQYLPASVWLAFLYGKSPETTAKYFLPEEIGNSAAVVLRSMAEEATHAFCRNLLIPPEKSFCISLLSGKNFR